LVVAPLRLLPDPHPAGSPFIAQMLGQPRVQGLVEHPLGELDQQARPGPTTGPGQRRPDYQLVGQLVDIPERDFVRSVLGCGQARFRRRGVVA
jgi:hypothetical protein